MIRANYYHKMRFYLLIDFFGFMLTQADRAYSAKTDARPQFQKMIKDSAGRLFDVVLVWKLEVKILQEEMEKPLLTREQILFWLHRFRGIDISKQDQRQLLIDSFVNAVYLYDDRIVMMFNSKEGARTITLDEIVR